MVTLSVLSLIFLPSIFATEGPVAHTPRGRIIGTTLISRLGRTIYSFKGIRYVKAPINELRFKDPQPANEWSGVYNATQDGPACPQQAIEPMDEDCLFLNVYTTELPGRRHNPKRPVIVYIHAGAFVVFTGRSDFVGPEYLLDEDVVLVTFNYRLGVLGFVSTGTKEAPGNLGLKDQVAALKWVKNNIIHFGGNPDLVTIYGYSAGSGSVILHMMSPMSRGLFHRAIAGSYSPLSAWQIQDNLIDLMRKQARAVDCPDNVEPVQILECFKTVPARRFGQTINNLSDYGGLTWQPVIEKDFGQERFIIDDPVKLALKGHFVNVPLMTGITKDEFGAVAYSWLSNQTALRELDRNFETIAPITFLYEENRARSQISRAIRKFYFGDGPIDNSSFTGLTQIYADGVTGFSINRAAKLLSAKNSKSVYYYEFTYQGRYSHTYLPGSNDSVPYGVSHHDDLIYLFYISRLFPKFTVNDPESPTVDKMTKMWANFARTGNPIPENTNLLDNACWEPFTAKNGKYMDIGSKLQMKTNLFAERYHLWESVVPLPLI